MFHTFVLILDQMKTWILNLLFPRCCPLCHEILQDQNQLICPECLAELLPIREPVCKKCGRPVSDERQEFCKDCSGTLRYFDEGRAVYLYDSKMRDSILHYKYFGRKEYGDFYAQAILRYRIRDIRRWDPDFIIPVPLHRSKLRRRGFNQAEEISERISAATGIATDSDMIRKINKTASQKKLGKAGRRRNLLQAFMVEKSVRGKKVLLIDDVFTTGSTLDALACTLKQAGAQNVYFLTICIAYQA